MIVQTPRSRWLVFFALLLSGLTVEAGPREYRVQAPITMQDPGAPGRIFQITADGPRTVHFLPNQGDLLPRLTARAGLKDPLVIHRATFQSLRIGEHGQLVSATRKVVISIAQKDYEVIVVGSAKNWAQVLDEVAPELAGRLQAGTLVPSEIGVVDGRLVLEIAGKLYPLRSPMTHRAPRYGAM